MIEETIVAACEKIFGKGNVYPDKGPFNGTRPICTYQFVGGIPSNTFCGNTDKQNARVQFNVWSKQRLTSNQLIRKLEAVLTEPPYRAVSVGGMAGDYEEATKTYGCRQDFSFWFDNSDAYLP